MQDNIFSRRLREARNAAGFTMKELGEKTNMTDRAIWNYENGRRYPALGAAYRIAEALHVTLSWLVGVD